MNDLDNTSSNLALPIETEMISEKSEKYQNCPKCEGKTKKNGMKYTDYHSSLSDHKLRIQGYACRYGCKKDLQYTGVWNKSVHPDLTKMQGMLGAKMLYKTSVRDLKISIINGIMGTIKIFMRADDTIKSNNINIL